MHRIRAESQGERHVHLRVAQGHALLMSGGLSWWVVRASGMRPTFGGYIRYESNIGIVTKKGRERWGLEPLTFA